MNFIVKLTVVAIIFLSCQQKNNIPEADNSLGHKVIVKEVLQTTNYTYLHVSEQNKELWLAAPRMDAKIGQEYYYKEGVKMEKFEGKEINRTFDEIYFVEDLIKQTLDNQSIIDTMHHSTKPKMEKANVLINKAKDGITIEELYQNKEKYNGKVVTINGFVTKINEAIMDKNWLHIQDGTEFSGKFDLTVTTNQIAKKTDTIAINGKVSVNKDFGFGYFYEVIVEDALIMPVVNK